MLPVAPASDNTNSVLASRICPCMMKYMPMVLNTPSSMNTAMKRFFADR